MPRLLCCAGLVDAIENDVKAVSAGLPRASALLELFVMRLLARDGAGAMPVPFDWQRAMKQCMRRTTRVAWRRQVGKEILTDGLDDAFAAFVAAGGGPPTEGPALSHETPLGYAARAFVTTSLKNYSRIALSQHIAWVLGAIWPEWRRVIQQAVVDRDVVQAAFLWVLDGIAGSPWLPAAKDLVAAAHS
jgi:hypothetical protein